MLLIMKKKNLKFKDPTEILVIYSYQLFGFYLMYIVIVTYMWTLKKNMDYLSHYSFLYFQ